MITSTSNILKYISFNYNCKSYKYYLFPIMKAKVPFSLVLLMFRISFIAPSTKILFSYKITIKSFHNDISLELTTES